VQPIYGPDIHNGTYWIDNVLSFVKGPYPFISTDIVNKTYHSTFTNQFNQYVYDFVEIYMTWDSNGILSSWDCNFSTWIYPWVETGHETGHEELRRAGESTPGFDPAIIVGISIGGLAFILKIDSFRKAIYSKPSRSLDSTQDQENSVDGRLNKTLKIARVDFSL